MTVPPRFAYMTNSVQNLQTARRLALAGGYTVDMLPPDAPPPESGTYDGILVDFLPTVRFSLTRKTYLEKLAQLAKALPVVVFDCSINYQEAALVRTAGLKWLPVLLPQAFDMLLAHPLAKGLAAGTQAEAEAAEQEDPAAAQAE